MTLIVPDAVSAKRTSPVSAFLPISSETLPRISRIGSSNRSASRSSIPPEMSMKKTLPGGVVPSACACTGSCSVNVFDPAMPRLPAVSPHEPATNETVREPAWNWLRTK